MRVKSVSKPNLAVFERYHLEESTGDRFLMFVYTQGHGQLIEVTREMEQSNGIAEKKDLSVKLVFDNPIFSTEFLCPFYANL